MERSRKIFCKIASASDEVVAAPNDYADREDLNGISRCHFQLEEDMRRISVACECLAGILEKPPAEEGPAVDVRIQDWFFTHEPQECLNTLSRMKSLLQQDSTFSWVPWTFGRGRGSTATQDGPISLLHAKDGFISCSQQRSGESFHRRDREYRSGTTSGLSRSNKMSPNAEIT